MKNIIISLCIILSLIYCASAVENNNQKISSELTDYERNIIHYEKELRRLVDGNWKQDKLFKHEDLSCCFNINLNKNKTLHSLKLINVFCDISDDSECPVLVKIAKETIINSFSDNDNSEIQKKLPLSFNLCFGSKEGNIILKKSRENNR